MDFNFKYFKNSLGQTFCAVRYNKRLRTVMVTWKGTAQLNSLEKVKAAVLKIIRQNKALFLVNDFQELYSGASEMLVHFLEMGWDNEVHDAGLRFVIHIWKEGIEQPPLSDKGAAFIRLCPSKLDAIAWIEKHLKTMPSH